MKILPVFEEYLFSQTNAQPVTVKNYLADVKRFILWYENRFHKAFSPEEITGLMISDFKLNLTTQPADKNSLDFTPVAARSMERYLSSLRKFFTFLQTEEVIATNPFEAIQEIKELQTTTDPWKVKEFKDYLYQTKSSAITIKNYIIDLHQFISWMTQINGGNDHYDIKERNIFNHITPVVIEEYKLRLIREAKAAPKTVNRKLSSLRRYITWAQGQGIIKSFEESLFPTSQQETPDTIGSPIEDVVADISLNATREEVPATIIPEEPLPFPTKKIYSSFPPLRLVQRSSTFLTAVLDTVIVLPLLAISDTVLYGMWKAKGSPVFVPANPVTLSNKIHQVLLRSGLLRPVAKKAKFVASLPKSFYAPLAISLRHAPLHKKALFHLKHTRPAWYKAYHSYAIVHYLHAAILVICMSAAGFGVAQAMSDTRPASVSFASLPDGPPRLLAFKGKLTRTDSSPITANTHLRFGIYNDAKASGSAKLWDEVREVLPSSDGSFSVTLGESRSIPQRLFSENARLYIGMTVESNSELTPRKQIPTDVLASTADTVQGLRPITDPLSSQKNALLVLDSSGNMVISGNANPTFVATGGKFTLSGQTLLLSTTPGSNADIQLIPDGGGMVDIQKPIHNTSNDINPSGIVGAVTLDDTVVISASQSGQSALYINQNSTGPLISASHSGIAKFTVDSDGSATFGDSIMLYGDSLSTTQTSFNLLTTSPINLNIGTSSTALSIGATGGVTTINNSQTVISGNLNVNGTTGITFGNAAAGINFSGQGSHLITASSGNLQLGAVTLTGATTLATNVSLVPSGTDGENNLGSASNPFDSLYVNSIISPSISSTTQWQSLNGVMIPNQLANGVMLGSTASASAVWQVFASGSNAGTASSSGNLSFTGPTTTVNQLNGGSLSFQTSAGGDAGLTPRLTITNSGNIGLGTTTPSYRLDIPNMADASGQGRANAWVTYSSSRFKENIEVINNPLEKIGRLQGVYYNWKEAYGGNRDIGFIAEEVGKVLPELVEYEADGINAKSLKYDRITALTIEGIKAQQDELKELQGKMNTFAFTDDRQFHIMRRDGTMFTVETDEGDLVKSKGVLAEAIIGVLRSGLIQAQQVTTDTLEAANATLGSMRVARVESEFMRVTDMTISGKLRATNATVLSLRTDTIESTADNSTLLLKLGASNLQFYGLSGNERKVVAAIDASGNASFSGLLTAKDATIEETLTTKKVIAQELQLTDEGLIALATNLSRYIKSGAQNNSEDIVSDQLDTDSGQLDDSDATASGSAMITPTPPVSPPNETLITDYTDFASDSASLNQSPDTSTISSIGTSLPSGAGYVFPDLSVTGMITISGNFILNEGAIDVVGEDLQIQPLRSGGVSFMAGLITITPSGDLAVQGNANFAKNVSVGGTLAANVISPLAGQDLVVKLGNDNQANAASFVVQDATGEAQLRIHETGDVTSEGNATFSKLLSKSLTIIRGSQVDASPIKTVASSSAGTAIILPGQTQRTIVTPFVFSKSLIYITPTSDTQGFIPYIARQTIEDPATGSEGSFTVEISEPVTKTIKINWWIMN